MATGNLDHMATTAPRSRPAVRVPAVTRAKLAGPAALGALVLLALFLRTRELGIGFWIDEGLSVGISDRPLGDIPDALRLDGSPPLYYLLLHVWMSVAGTSEEAVRALSVVFGLVAVPVAWWAARTLFGTRSGWMAAVLAATSPFLTQYAQEARMYALTVLLSLIASAAFARMVAFEDDRRPWAIGFAVAFAAMLYTHNWALFFGAACGAAWLFLLVRARRAGAAGPADQRRHRVRRGGAPVPALDPDHAVPGGAHGRAVGGGADRGRPARRARADARPVRADRAAAGGRRRPGGTVRAPRRPAVAARPRGRLPARDLGHDRAAGVGRLAGVARVGEPLSRGRRSARCCSPLAAGLGNAGKLGIVGLVVAAALAAGDTAPDDKSNVREVADAIAPSLAPGDLVVSTQPEQVSVLEYYLPDGLRFATLTGEVRDTGVTDWRDGPERLGATSAERDLAPLLDRLKPGQRVVLVTPIFADIRRWQAPWTELVRLRSGEWRQHLGNDERFAVSTVEPVLPIERRPNAVQATVLVKTSE